MELRGPPHVLVLDTQGSPLGGNGTFERWSLVGAQSLDVSLKGMVDFGFSLLHFVSCPSDESASHLLKRLTI